MSSPFPYDARESPASRTLLSVEDVTVRFGGLLALDRASFTVEAGQCCGLIGPNGAGKTTLFNCVSGLVRPQSGRIEWGGADVLRQPRHRVVATGIARTFQNLGLISALSVIDNVMLGAYARTTGGFVTSPVTLPSLSHTEREVRDQAVSTLDELGLAHLAHHQASGLPFGTLKRIELARALMTRPRLVLLDEPANGLNHNEVDELGRLLSRLIRQRDLTVLLVEHHMGLVMRVCDKVVVLDSGQVIATGTPAEVRDDPAVVAAYLGRPA